MHPDATLTASSLELRVLFIIDIEMSE